MFDKTVHRTWIVCVQINDKADGLVMELIRAPYQRSRRTLSQTEMARMTLSQIFIFIVLFGCHSLKLLPVPEFLTDTKRITPFHTFSPFLSTSFDLSYKSDFGANWRKHDNTVFARQSDERSPQVTCCDVVEPPARRSVVFLRSLWRVFSCLQFG